MLCGRQFNPNLGESPVAEQMQGLVDGSTSSSSGGHYGSIGEPIFQQEQLYPPGLILHITEDRDDYLR